MAEEPSVWRKFFSPKEQVHKHWYSAVDNFQFASAEFYTKIETQLKTREVPGLEISRVEFSEGGMLSFKRQYLRLKRERLVFDICAAPFGASYFFSFRFVELPLGIKPTELVVFLVALMLVFALCLKLFGTVWGLIALLAIIGFGLYIMRNAVALGLNNLDADLLKTPVIGPLYEVLFHKETYYRQDTRQMYLCTVNAITELVLDEVTAAKGVKVVKRYDRKQLHGDIYEERTAQREQKPAVT